MARLVLLMMLIFGCAARPTVEPNPYTADQIERLLRGAVPHERILTDAARECISFRITPEVQQRLTGAGATAAFIEALGGTCYRPARGPA